MKENLDITTKTINRLLFCHHLSCKSFYVDLCLSIWPRNWGRQHKTLLAALWLRRANNHISHFPHRFSSEIETAHSLQIRLFWRRKIVIGFARFLTSLNFGFIFYSIKKIKTTKKSCHIHFKSQTCFCPNSSRAGRGSTYQTKGGFPLSRNFYVRK